MSVLPSPCYSCGRTLRGRTRAIGQYLGVPHPPCFSEAERAALDFSLVASQVPNAVDAEIKERLYKHWNEGEIVEMLGVISLFGYLNRWNDSMGTAIEDGAVESGDQYLGKHGWKKGKHGGSSY